MSRATLFEPMGPRRCALLAGLLLLWLLPGGVFARVVKLDLKPGLVASAEYREGDADAGSLLILHGFLQTAHFPTVQRLADGLAESGYTLLVPTLSLGVTERRRSVPCEALHLQTLDDDVSELSQWVDWLYRKKKRPVTLIGHSAGGHVITRYLHDHPEAPVGRVILISLSFPAGRVLGPEPPEPDAIGDYALSFCQHYPTTPRAFHSYVDWGPRQMLATMKQLGNRLSVIVGSGDKRIRPRWVEALGRAGIRLETIEEANHFFDSAHEFDLLEAVESLLDSDR